MRGGASGFDSASGGGRRVCRGRRRLRMLALLLGWNQAVVEGRKKVKPRQKGRRRARSGVRVVDVRLHLPRLVGQIRAPSRPGLALL